MCRLVLILQLAIFTVITISSNGFTGYEIFPGFDVKPSKPSTYDAVPVGSTSTSTSSNTTSASTPNTTTSTSTERITTYFSNIYEELLNQKDDGYGDMDCPEEEVPANIGAYMVPSQRDLVMIYRNGISVMFDKYHRKILEFLRDIKEVSKATADEEEKCTLKDKTSYRKCIHKICKQYQHATKIQVRTLEKQRHEVKTFMAGHVCNMSAIKINPLKLLRAITIENVSLDFALPGFLRLLHECSKFCITKSYVNKNLNKLHEESVASNKYINWLGSEN